jgi:hypothetical protein
MSFPCTRLSLYNIISLFFICVQIASLAEWKRVKPLLDSGIGKENPVVASFMDTMVTMIRNARPDCDDSITLYPLGGQHYTAANQQCLEQYPEHKEFQYVVGIVYLPMPEALIVEVSSIFR